ncbi:MAG: lipid carrier--UDP-N-acetylgalactosaminyltransferase, partial [Flavobacteriales bacterium CG_4_9_14_3_um_filter_40_17]
MYKFYFKPLIDFFAALFGLILLSPLLLFVWLGLLFSNNGKPFFLQKRPGKKGKIFIIIKFRTMNDRLDKSGKLLPDGERLTAIGKFVR